jgi:MFS family permease
VITGWLSEVFGRRRYFAGSIALFTIASFAFVPPLLLFMRRRRNTTGGVAH